MADEKDAGLLHSLFISAKEQYESGMRRAGVLLAVSAIFHLAVFTPYIEAHREIVRARTAQQELAAQHTRLEEIGKQLAAIDGLVRDKLPGLLKRHLHGMTQDFGNLSALLAAIKAGDPPADDIQLQRPFTPQIQATPNLAIQQPIPRESTQPGPTGAQRESQFPEKVIELLREEAPFEQVRTALLPYIQNTIITPRFNALNTGWRAQVERSLAPRIEKVDEMIARGESDLPEETTRWQSLRTASTMIKEKLLEHRFQPPPGNEWWRTVVDKTGEFSRIEDFALDNLKTGMRLGSVSRQIQDVLARSMQQQQVLVEEMLRQIDTAETRFKEQSVLLSELGSGFRALALDLRFVVGWFPLVLAVLFIYLSITLSHRLQVYVNTTLLLEHKESGDLAVLLPLALNSAQSEPRLRLNASLRSILASAWILAAGWQLAGWEEMQLSRLFPLIVGAVAAILVSERMGYKKLKTLINRLERDQK